MKRSIVTLILICIFNSKLHSQSFGLTGGINKSIVRSPFITDPQGMKAILYDMEYDDFGEQIFIPGTEKLRWSSFQYCIGPAYAYEDGLFYASSGFSLAIINISSRFFKSESEFYYISPEEPEYTTSDLSFNMSEGINGGVMHLQVVEQMTIRSR